MNPTESEQFIPSEIWTPTHEHSELDEPIQRALNEMNLKNSGQLIDSLKQSVEHSKLGVSFAVLKGENPSEYSDSEALVMFNPFANAATPNMLVRAEFIREVAKYSDVRDADGKLKPVVMLASPGLAGSSLRLTREERQGLRKGELGPAARELLRAVSEKEIGQVALLGFSQGADVAVAGARSAYSAHLDIQAVAAGDPAGVETRGMRELVGDFFKAGVKDLKEAVDATGLDVQKKALGTGTVDFSRFGISAMRPTNLAMYKGLGANVFESRVQEILDEGKVNKLVVAYGAKSAIAKPEEIEPTLQSLHEYDSQNILTSISIEGSKHTWGDELTLLAKLCMRAVA